MHFAYLQPGIHSIPNKLTRVIRAKLDSSPLKLQQQTLNGYQIDDLKTMTDANNGGAGMLQWIELEDPGFFCAIFCNPRGPKISLEFSRRLYVLFLWNANSGSYENFSWNLCFIILLEKVEMKLCQVEVYPRIFMA